MKNASRKLKLQRERAYRKAFLASETEQPQEAKYALRLRALYFLTRPFFRKKRIWVSFDKLYKAGDNGEYMYQYGKGTARPARYAGFLLYRQSNQP